MAADALTRYWRSTCNDPDITERTGAPLTISWTTHGEHKDVSADAREWAFPCPICKKEHVALEISHDEFVILSDQDEEFAGTVPDFVVDGIGDWVGPPEELITIDVMQVTTLDEDDFCTVGSNCSTCDEDIQLGQRVMLWGEPLGDAFVAIKTFDKDECLQQALEAFREKKKGASAMLIRYKS